MIAHDLTRNFSFFLHVLFFFFFPWGICEIIGIEVRAWERRGVLKCTFIYIPFLLTVSVPCLVPSHFLVHSSSLSTCVLCP